MYVGPGPGGLILGVLMLISLLLGWKIRRDKGLLAYLLVLAAVGFAAMAMVGPLFDGARPGSGFRRLGRDPVGPGLMLLAPYLLGGVLAWLFGAGRSAGGARPGLTRALAPERRAVESSLGSQTLRRVIVTVSAAVISYFILSFLGLENTPSVVTAIGLALLTIVFG